MLTPIPPRPRGGGPGCVSGKCGISHALNADSSNALPGRSSVDSRLRSSDIGRVLKSRLAFFLLLGALSGLFGLQSAYAFGPLASPTAMAVGHATPVTTDCADMVTQQPEQKHAPCKGLTLDCVAQMGCVVPMTVESVAPVGDCARVPGEPEFWPAVTVLAGNSISPEPHPPSILV